MTLLGFLAAWFELPIATACLFSGIATRGKRLERKRLAQWEADRFDVMVPVARFSPIRNGAVNSHAGNNTVTGRHCNGR
jgi:hypothetical protein